MTQPSAARTDEDGNRFYPIPRRSDGMVVQRPNISSTVDVLQSFGLMSWKLRMVAVGLAHRDDLIARVAAAHLETDTVKRKRAIKAIIDDCVDHGQCMDPEKGFLANDFGSAIHLLTEHADDGLIPDIMTLPTTVHEHILHYVETLDRFGIEMVHSEFTVYSDLHCYAGTGDRIVRFRTAPTRQAAEVFAQFELGRGCFVLDIKTGAIYDKVAMQLAALVNAEGIWDADTYAHQDLPDDLRTDIGFALQIKADGAKLIPADLHDAWPAFVGALAVQRFVSTKPLHKSLVAPKSSSGAQSSESITAAGTKAEASPLEPISTGGAEGPSTSTPPAAPPVDHTKSPFDGLPDGNGGIQRHPTANINTTANVGSFEAQQEAFDAEAAIKATFPGAVVVEDSTPQQLTRAYLYDRLVKLVTAEASIVWPEGVLTFRQADEAIVEHSAEHLRLIDKALWDAEAKIKAPFPDEAPAEVRLALTEPPPPIDDVLLKSWNAAFDTLELAHRDAVQTFFGDHITETNLVHLENIIGALDLGVLAARGHDLTVDLPALLIGPKQRFKNRSELVRAAKTTAVRLGLTKPSKAQDVFADVALTAALACE